MVKNLIVNLFGEPVWDDKYIKTKIKSYGDRVLTNFQDKKVPKEGVSHKCLSLIMLDSVLKTSKKYYPQTLLEECKYKITKKKMENLFNDDFDLSSESDSKSDNESRDEGDE